MKCVILPEENRKDYSDLQDYIREGLEVHFATDYKDVFKIMFPDVDLPESAWDITSNKSWQIWNCHSWT